MRLSASALREYFCVHWKEDQSWQQRSVFTNERKLLEDLNECMDSSCRCRSRYTNRCRKASSVHSAGCSSNILLCRTVLCELEVGTSHGERRCVRRLTSGVRNLACIVSRVTLAEFTDHEMTWVFVILTNIDYWDIQSTRWFIQLCNRYSIFQPCNSNREVPFFQWARPLNSNPCLGMWPKDERSDSWRHWKVKKVLLE